MKKKITGVVILLCIVFMTFNSVFAADGLISVNTYESIYKLSGQGEKLDLPFVNIFGSPSVYDEDVKVSGISFGNTTIDVNKKLEGVHLIFSQDMINVKGEIEHAFIYGGNVVISGKLTGDSLIMGERVQILENAVIDKDIVIIANYLEIKGNVKGNVIATVSNEANISGKLDKDLRILGNNINLENETIAGDIYIETNEDMSEIKAKYPNATIAKIVEQSTTSSVQILNILSQGVIVVIIYGVICYFVTRKENNIVTSAVEKFKAHSMYGILASLIMFMLVILLPILAIILAIAGIGIVVWPILIAYISVMLMTISTSTLVVGTTIYEAVKEKVSMKLRIPCIAGIFMVLYAITVIPFIANYSIIAMHLIALAIIITYFTKRTKKSEVEAVNTIEENTNK